MREFIADGSGRSNAQLIHRITLYYGDITKQDDVDAIVTAMPVSLDMASPLNQALIAAAGQQLDEFILENIYKPRVGDVFAVPPFALPLRYIFCAILPDWDTSLGFEDRDLTRCFRHGVQLASRVGIKRVAFPPLGTGERAQPLPRVARLSIGGIMDRLTPDIEEVRIVCNRDELITVYYERLQKMGWKGKVVYQE
ncbi:MAG: macro domain-containing protein [Alphaproteobacteria bacterium]|nr:macro domain-containing protein [Alphaproteobacteria bacterium]